MVVAGDREAALGQDIVAARPVGGEEVVGGHVLGHQ